MSKIRITKKLIDALEVSDSEYLVWDSELTGFGVRVRSSGHMTYVLQYRAGSGRSAPTKKLTIGAVGKLTPDEARTLAKRGLGAIMSGEDPALDKANRRTSPTINELVADFLADHVKTKRKPKTYALYETLLRLYVSPAIGAKKALAVTVSDIAKIHKDLRDKPTTANRVVNTIAAMYGWACDHERVDAGTNPCRKVERYHEEGRERYLTTDEYRRLCDALELAETDGLAWSPATESKHTPKDVLSRTVRFDPSVIAAIRLFLFTGARLREILHMRWEDFDRDRGIVLVPDSKTGKKTIVLSDAAVAVIDDLSRAGDYIIAGQSPNKPRSDLKRPWGRIREAAAIGDVRLHDLRRSFASVGVGGGYGLPIMGKLLGHTQAKTTQKYAHLDAEPMRRVTNEIGRRIASAMKDGSASKAFTNDGEADFRNKGKQS